MKERPTPIDAFRNRVASLDDEEPLANRYFLDGFNVQILMSPRALAFMGIDILDSVAE
jgi:hypothetical protein